MNLEIIHNFEKFLRNKGYSPQTIHTYTKALEQWIPSVENVLSCATLLLSYSSRGYI